MVSRLSTAVGYLLPLLLVYVLVYLPLSKPPSAESEVDIECHPESLSGIGNSLIRIASNRSCPEHLYQVHILNRDPLVIYIPHFLSDNEADHLVDISLPNFAPSTVYDGHAAQINTQVRKSEVALLPDEDETVQCIGRRAQAFQGFRPAVYIEKMRSQRYGPSGHYAHHFDWTGARRKADRVSTFMVYLQADCVGGGTNFPRLQMPENRDEWCEWLECDADAEGVTFKPVKGSAVYWENLKPGGGGYEDTWHAGFPVIDGTKIGLNIWSWRQPCAFEW